MPQGAGEGEGSVSEIIKYTIEEREPCTCGACGSRDLGIVYVASATKSDGTHVEYEARNGPVAALSGLLRKLGRLDGHDVASAAIELADVLDAMKGECGL